MNDEFRTKGSSGESYKSVKSVIQLPRSRWLIPNKAAQ